MNPSPEPTQLSVIIPVYEEARTITSVISEVASIVKILAPGAGEILVIDDASSQPVRLDGLVTSPSIRVIRRPRRGGSGAARKTGIAEAKGEWIAWIDGDGTYPAEDLARLWEARPDYDQVIGARPCDHGPLRWLRLSVKRLACLWAERRWKRAIPDLNSGLRLIRKSAASFWVDQLPDGFSCTTTATLAALAHRQRLAFVSIRYYARGPGAKSKFRPIRDTLRFFAVVHKWKSETTP